MDQSDRGDVPPRQFELVLRFLLSFFFICFLLDKLRQLILLLEYVSSRQAELILGSAHLSLPQDCRCLALATTPVIKTIKNELIQLRVHFR